MSCALEFHQEAVKFIALGFGCDENHTHWFNSQCTNRGVSPQEKEAWRVHFFERTRPATQGSKPRRGHDTPWIAGKGSLKKLVQFSHLLLSFDSGFSWFRSEANNRQDQAKNRGSVLHQDSSLRCCGAERRRPRTSWLSTGVNACCNARGSTRAHHFLHGEQAVFSMCSICCTGDCFSRRQGSAYAELLDQGSPSVLQSRGEF